jgi:hypothetical protein
LTDEETEHLRLLTPVSLETVLNMARSKAPDDQYTAAHLKFAEKEFLRLNKQNPVWTAKWASKHDEVLYDLLLKILAVHIDVGDKIQPSHLRKIMPKINKVQTFTTCRRYRIDRDPLVRDTQTSK